MKPFDPARAATARSQLIRMLAERLVREVLAERAPQSSERDIENSLASESVDLQGPSEPSEVHDIIDSQQFAALLKCSVEQVDEAAREGRIPGFKEGRGWLFVRADALAFLAERARHEAAERQTHRRAAVSVERQVAVPQKRTRRRTPPKLP